MKSSFNYSPLRYPGGKSCLTNFLTDIAKMNNLIGGNYLELYAGGSGAALTLLFNGVFNRIHINDYDYNIYSMWFSILNHPQAFINRIIKTPVSITEWHKQKIIYNKGKSSNIIDLGFATFFLNRTNRSGIIFKAGPIGGLDQKGNYKIDARFNKLNLINRIKKIAKRRDDIILTNLDALQILKELPLSENNKENLFIYMDPPYYKKGKELYLNNYIHQNHLNLSKALASIENIKWLVSYDNVSEIKGMYETFRMASFDLGYTLQTKKLGNELLIFSHNLELPRYITIRKKQGALTLLNK